MKKILNNKLVIAIFFVIILTILIVIVSKSKIVKEPISKTEKFSTEGGEFIAVTQHLEEMQEAQTELTNFKSKIATAITEKGVSTDATATADEMSTNIKNIKVASTPAMLFFNYNRGSIWAGTKATASLTYTSTYNGQARIYYSQYGGETANQGTQPSHGGSSSLTLNGTAIGNGSLVTLKSGDKIVATREEHVYDTSKPYLYYECFVFLAVCGVQ